MNGVSSAGRGMQKGMRWEEEGRMLREMGSARLMVVLTYIRDMERFADLRICSDRLMDMFEARLEQRPFLKAPMTPSLSLRMRMSALEMPNWEEMRIANSTAIVSSQPISCPMGFRHPSRKCHASQRPFQDMPIPDPVDASTQTL
jgi:hypothetical protein